MNASDAAADAVMAVRDGGNAVVALTRIQLGFQNRLKEALDAAGIHARTHGFLMDGDELPSFVPDEGGASASTDVNVLVHAENADKQAVAHILAHGGRGRMILILGLFNDRDAPARFEGFPGVRLTVDAH